MQISQPPDLDPIDLQLLSELEGDARLTLHVLAERAGLSMSACHRRIRNLEKLGAIKGYNARLDMRMLGFGLLAFVRVELAQNTKEARNAFEQAVIELDMISECHLIAGQGCYILRIAAQNLEHYETVITPTLATLPFAQEVRAEFSGREVKPWTGLKGITLV